MYVTMYVPKYKIKIIIYILLQPRQGKFFFQVFFCFVFYLKFQLFSFALILLRNSIQYSFNQFVLIKFNRFISLSQLIENQETVLGLTDVLLIN